MPFCIPLKRGDFQKSTKTGQENFAGYHDASESKWVRVELEKAEAKCFNGILTVTLPKAEAAKPKQITIHAS